MEVTEHSGSEITDDLEGDYTDDLDDCAEEPYEETFTLRCKWQLDGVSTMDEAVDRMYMFIEHLKQLKEEGWEFSQPMEDDYGILVKRY